jgi:hypothetical protein
MNAMYYADFSLVYFKLLCMIYIKLSADLLQQWVATHLASSFYCYITADSYPTCHAPIIVTVGSYPQR